MLKKTPMNINYIISMFWLSSIIYITTAQQKEREDEVITHECVCMTAPCQAHSTVELETSYTHTHTRTHPDEKTCPYCWGFSLLQKEFILLQS